MWVAGWRQSSFTSPFPLKREKEVRETRSRVWASCRGVGRVTNTSKKPRITKSTDSAPLLFPKHPFLICVTMPVWMAPDLQEGARSKTHLNKHTSELSGIRRKSSQGATSFLSSSTPRHTQLTMCLCVHLDCNPNNAANRKVHAPSCIVTQTSYS